MDSMRELEVQIGLDPAVPVSTRSVTMCATSLRHECFSQRHISRRGRMVYFKVEILALSSKYIGFFGPPKSYSVCE
jgi:hypothetical protein